ncbi:MAG: thioredoxin family protein ['Candidatus Kapabacteria' thiocyanatum]|uniref:Thiol reductase thioredoxin n=1 Tax=Candidatus Kapaibacterium thiocyanatum TaxID=1895771 RepID=A0A1M3L2D3_9BACT|nr:thioredoxin family protein ['Candidatus Kapabacteria' thiocyanatum]OJX59389.1 MAG: thiol reductase thioredoxin ['Candidatus Kapabacteria' thiocyanatum]
MAVQVVTDQELDKELHDNSKVIIKYFADWCGSCKLFSPKYRRLSEDERFQDITFLDVNAETNPEARRIAGVDNLPFFATFKDGQLVEGGATAKEESVVAMLERLQQ